VEFRILGPLEVVENGRTVRVTGKQGALLAALLLEPRKTVSRDQLVDALWGDDPPETAAKAIQVFAARLRKALPGLPLATRGSTYVLEVDADEIDCERFEALVRRAREASAEGATENAASLLEEALGLWRGPPLADVDEPFARSAAGALEERRLAALEDRIELELALGHHRQLVAELEPLAADHPLRERLRSHLMLALYRSGRQAEALEAYTQTRRTLVDELGLEPSRELQQLQRRILAQDDSLDFQPRAARQTVAGGTSHWRIVAASAVAATAVIAGVIAVLVAGKSGAAIALQPRAVARLDARTGELTMKVPLGATPLFLAPDARGTWAATEERTVVHVDARSGRVDATASLGFPPSDLVALDGGAWVGSSVDPLVAKISRRYERVVSRVALPRVSDRAAALGPTAPRLADGGGSLWVTSGQTTVVRVDPRANRIAKSIMPRSGASGAVAYGAGGVWIGGTNAVARVSPASGVVVSIVPLDGMPAAMAVDHGALWIALADRATIVHIDAYADTLVARIAVQGRPTAIAAAAGAVWTIAGSTLIRIDERTNKVTRRIRVRGRPTALAASGHSVWIASA